MMMFLTRLLLVGLLCLFPAVAIVAAPAADNGDVTARALKLYEKHRYAEAARLLQHDLATMDADRKAAASLALGMNYLGSGTLYRDLKQMALAIELDYLTQLSRQKSAVPSRYADYYLGQVLFESGKPAEAVTHLRKFAAAAPEAMKPFALIELGLVYNKQKQAQKVSETWLSLDQSKPEIKAALAGAYALSGVQEQKAVSMADAAMSEAKLQGYTPTSRMLRNLLRAYSHGGAPAKAMALLNVHEFKDASYVEDIGVSKSISFYDVSLFGDMSNTHLNMAVIYLEQASRDAKLAATASFYLADAYLQLGKVEQSLRSAAAFLSQPKVPMQYRSVALANQASAHSFAGRKTDAMAAWLSLADKAGEDLDVLAVVMQSCAQAKTDCAQLEKLALIALEKGEGKKTFSLSAALGKYYLQQKDYVKAVLYMEAGRDKAHKNKIEVNDPLMLIGLAEAYYRNKNFSENLEIYFELGKHYPVVRQIQEAMQGIYAMEQQSAGDVKIF